jgi:hypothetical protein
MKSENLSSLSKMTENLVILTYVLCVFHPPYSVLFVIAIIFSLSSIISLSTLLGVLLTVYALFSVLHAARQMIRLILRSTPPWLHSTLPYLCTDIVMLISVPS